MHATFRCSSRLSRLVCSDRGLSEVIHYVKWLGSCSPLYIFLKGRQWPQGVSNKQKNDIQKIILYNFVPRTTETRFLLQARQCFGCRRGPKPEAYIGVPAYVRNLIIRYMCKLVCMEQNSRFVQFKPAMCFRVITTEHSGSFNNLT